MARRPRYNPAMLQSAANAAHCPPQQIAVTLAGAGTGWMGWMTKAGVTGTAFAAVMICICACDPGLENVPPGWEHAKVISLHHSGCGVDYEAKMSVSHKTDGNQVRLSIKELSMRCMPIPNKGLTAAMRSQSSRHHEILIHPVEPLDPYESCNCRTDAEAVFELGSGNHQIDIYTWTMWGEEPWKTTSVYVTL